MNNQALLADNLNKNCYLFQDLTAEELQQVQQLAQVQTFAANEVLIKEAAPVETVFMIIEGEVEIRKSAGLHNQQHHSIVHLKSLETIGEMALLDLEPASAEAIAITTTQVLAFPLKALRALAFFSKIATNIGIHLNQRLRYTNNVTVKSLQLELETSKKMTFVLRFFITTVLVILLYVIALNIAIRYLSVVQTSTMITVPFLIIFLFMYSFFLKTSQMPAAFFGITCKNWRASLSDSLKFTIPALLILLLFKWSLIHYNPRYAHEPLFNPFNVFNPNSTHLHAFTLLILFAGLYAIFSIVQEFLVRGVIQSSLEYFLQGRHKRFSAVLLANISFSILHIHVSIMLAILVFFPGLLWGFLYTRHKSLIGVSVSHVLIGLWVGFILGFNFIFL